MIIDIQRRIMEAGRIRIGETRQTSGGKDYPAKLETFRLTSADRQRIEQAAALFGGTATEWQAPAGKQWQVTTGTDVLDVIVPPSEMAFSQAYEIWSAGGCQRRCDGAFEQISDGPCLCDPEARECNVHTRISLLIRDLPGLGLWRLDTSGYYAAAELAGAVQVLAAAAGRGVLLPARLMLQQRSAIRRGDDGKPQTRRYAVPVLDIDITPGQLLLGGAIAKVDLVALEAPPVPAKPLLLAPVPDTAPEWPVPSVHEQVALAAQLAPPKPRANAARPIPPTGLEPRTFDEARLDPPPADEEPAAEPVQADGMQWLDLVALLNEDPVAADPKPTLEGRLRSLYTLMEACGLWKPGSDGTDALHLALKKKAGVAHVNDLNKEPLLDFCQKSWDAAKKAVAAG